MWHISVLWSLDGTLLDNDEVLFDRLRLVAAKHGVALSQDEFFQDHTFNMPDGNGDWASVTMRLHGASDKALYYWMASRKPAFGGKVTPLAWIGQMQASYETLSSRVSVRPQVAGFIRALDSQGVVQGLVTNTAPALVEHAFKQLGDAAKCFSFVQYGDQYTLPKPYPAAYQAASTEAVRLLQERHGDACRPLVMAVEDSMNGIRAAHAARLTAVQYLKPGQVPFSIPAGSPEFRAVRDMRTFAEILVTLSGT